MGYDRKDLGGGVRPWSQVPNQNGQDTTAYEGIWSSGMPNYYDVFGNRTITLKMNAGQGFAESQKLYLQTFFPSTGNKYPYNNFNQDGNPIPQEVGPNWYFYYRQVIQNDGYFFPSQHRYENANVSSFSRKDENEYNIIYLANDTHGGGPTPNAYQYSMRLFQSPGDGELYIKRVGSVGVGGIYNFISAAGHEAGHLYYANKTDVQGYVIDAGLQQGVSVSPPR